MPAVIEIPGGYFRQYVTVVDSVLPRNAGGRLLTGKLREQVNWGDPLR
jgi:hypothetical protein